MSDEVGRHAEKMLDDLWTGYQAAELLENPSLLRVVGAGGFVEHYGPFDPIVASQLIPIWLADKELNYTEVTQHPLYPPSGTPGMEAFE